MEDEETSSFNTPLFKVSTSSFAKNGFSLYVKFEGSNPTGTQKDRIAKLHVSNAKRQGYYGVTVGTCGNYGASIAYYAKLYGLKAKIFVPFDFHPVRLEKYANGNVEIERVKGYYEEAVIKSIEFAEKNGFYDANAGSKNSRLDYEGYKAIAWEIVKRINKNPDLVIVPVGNGTTLYGIYEGFRELKNSGLIDRIPSMVGVAPANANPIVASYLSGSNKYHDLAPEKIKITEENEPLANYKSLDGEKAFEAIKVSKGFAVSIEDEEMHFGAAFLKSEIGLNALPASASAVAALWKIPHEVIHNKVIVSLVTGSQKVTIANSFTTNDLGRFV